MSLLDHLAVQAPRRVARDIKEDPRYQIALRYFDEITELRERRYTWGQINHAANLAAQAEGIFGGSYKNVQTDQFYKRIQKERGDAMKSA